MTVPSETSGTIDPREVSLYAGHFDALWGVAWSPDGTRLLSGSHDGTARVWDANSGIELFALAGPSLSISAVAWSPDGTRLLTAAEDHSVRIWDATTGADLLTPGVGGSGVRVRSQPTAGGRVGQATGTSLRGTRIVQRASG